MALLGARRKRYLILTAVLSLLVLLYVTTGPSNTRDSDFYRKTVELMNTRKNAPPASDHTSASTGAQVPLQDASGSSDSASETAEQLLVNKEALKGRLQEAAVAAKKSADEKGQEMKDAVVSAAAKAKAVVTSVAAQATSAAGAAVAGAEKTVAGRKKFPIDGGAARDGGSVISANEDGVAHVGPHADLSPNGDVAAAGADGSGKEAANPKDELKRLLNQGPMVIFSKSYCPYSKKAKRILLEQMVVVPTPVVVELDQHDMGGELQDLLGASTGRRTVPNVMVNGKSLGGGDDVERMLNDETLGDKIKEMGGGKIEKAERKAVKMERRWVGSEDVDV